MADKRENPLFVNLTFSTIARIIPTRMEFDKYRQLLPTYFIYIHRASDIVNTVGGGGELYKPSTLKETSCTTKIRLTLVNESRTTRNERSYKTKLILLKLCADIKTIEIIWETATGGRTMKSKQYSVFSSLY